MDLLDAVQGSDVISKIEEQKAATTRKPEAANDVKEKKDKKPEIEQSDATATVTQTVRQGHSFLCAPEMEDLKKCLESQIFAADFIMAKYLELERIQAECFNIIIKRLKELNERLKYGELSMQQVMDVHEICNSVRMAYMFKAGTTEPRYSLEELSRYPLDARGMVGGDSTGSPDGKTDSDATIPCFEGTMDSENDASDACTYVTSDEDYEATSNIIKEM
ncbi:hypothetical protein KIN20_013847 [Parelaphostrongylus tenuis]|uniref:Uncharacterized protein n=1 Tax=Parelaphostrongylus tenuis TaxID=148309 RepID=A0AAD5MV18_PARTN|nr:hypothetical protein KIN20_013847 [Parelaphostrongylus tenuis]